MPSPFPGMDPYLEGYLWPDVHHRLATALSRQLTPRLRPRYVARLEIYIVEDSAPEAEIGIMYPDVEVLLVGQQHPKRPNASAEQPGGMAAPLVLPMLEPVTVRIAMVEIRDVAHNQLVTCIEILSPVNKREPGLTHYRQKRQRRYAASVHLLEIDLLRRGMHPLSHPRLPDVPYLVTLTRAQAGQVEVWPIELRNPLPTVPVPLHAPDPDVPLELGAALASIYDEAAYDLSIDYTQAVPPPALAPADAAWVQTLVSGETS